MTAVLVQAWKQRYTLKLMQRSEISKYLLVLGVCVVNDCDLYLHTNVSLRNFLMQWVVAITSPSVNDVTQ